MDRMSDARKRTAAVINLTSIFEKADESILPAMYKYISRDFKATPSQMAALTVARGVTQAVTSPIGGIAGHTMNRIHIILYGCLIWATMTWLFGLSKWAPNPLLLGGVAWGLNGLGLSLVVPNSQSVIADYYPSTSRGSAFGLLYFTAGVGAILGSLYATNVAGLDFDGVEGWQFVMFSLAIMSVLIAFLNNVFARDPRDFLPANPEDYQEDGVEVSGKKDAWQDIRSAITTVIKIPTFSIIILQGIVGSMPWKGIASFGVLYFQLIGMSDFQASMLFNAFLLGTALGGVLGGFLGDQAAKRWPNHGRVFVCQFSVFAGIPLSITVFQGLPRNGDASTFLAYVVVLFLQGLLISWAAPACNNPIFAEIVPARMRNIIYSFDRCFEDAIASPVAYFVGWAATAWFGYSGEATTSSDVATNLSRANAMGQAIMWFSVVPWILCLVFYTGLHFTYPKDRIAGAYVRVPDNL